MSKTRTILTLLVVLAMPALAFAAPAPYVANHLVTDPSWIGPAAPFETYIDIPGSEQTLTLPPGTALITWACTMLPDNGGVRIRPRIGDDFPVDGAIVRSGRSSGSWLTTTTGGSLTVGLQVKSAFVGNVAQTPATDTISWSIMIPTETGDPVPAIGDAGLGIMIVTLLAAGGWIVSRRRGMPA